MAELDTQFEKTNAYLQRFAEKALLDASNNSRKISTNIKPDLSSPRVDVDLNKPNLKEPPNFSDLFPDADGTSEEVTRLNGEVNEWLSRYFPAIDECLQNVPDEWLCNIITNKNPFGLHESVFEAIWNSARDREERQFRAADATLRTEFSSRGFTLPPGAYITALDRARQQASEAVQEVNRTEAIRNEEVKLQLLQFAVEQANQYKMAIMSALADFYRIWVTIPDKEIERARVRAQAYSSLYSALSTYYNVEISFEELRLRAEGLDAETQMSTDRNKIALYDAGGANSALATAVRGFADVAAQASSASGALIAQIEGI